MANFPDTRISLILRLGQNSDVQAWHEFAEIYAPALHQLALRRGMQPADAEDVTQEILFGVARAIERFQPDPARARFRTWLSRIARNMIADFCAGRAKRSVSQAMSDSWLEAVCADPLPTEVEADEVFEQEYQIAIFRLAAARTEKRVAKATWLAFERTAVHGEAAELVAKELGLSLGNVYVARCRVLKLLRMEAQVLGAAYASQPEPLSATSSLRLLPKLEEHEA